MVILSSTTNKIVIQMPVFDITHCTKSQNWAAVTILKVYGNSISEEGKVVRISTQVIETKNVNTKLLQKLQSRLDKGKTFFYLLL